MLQLLSEPFAATRLLPDPTPPTGAPTSTRDPGDLLLGVQGLLTLQSGALPTIALAYIHRVRTGSAPDLDIGSSTQSANLLVSGDLGRFHYDTNFGIAQQNGLAQQNAAPQPATSAAPLRRAQFNQSLSVTHDLLPELLGHDLELTAELWHVTQPLVTTARSGLPISRGNAVGALFALGYALRPNLVLDAGLDHGLTSTSTDWQGFAGLSFLLPHRLWPHRPETSPRIHRHRR